MRRKKRRWLSFPSRVPGNAPSQSWRVTSLSLTGGRRGLKVRSSLTETSFIFIPVFTNVVGSKAHDLWWSNTWRGPDHEAVGRLRSLRKKKKFIFFRGVRPSFLFPPSFIRCQIRMSHFRMFMILGIVISFFVHGKEWEQICQLRNRSLSRCVDALLCLV